MDIASHLLLSIAASPWVYGVVFLLVVLDGICAFPPSETVLVVLGATSVAAGSPNIVLLIAAAACGAFVGDNVAFGIGRALGAGRFAWTRSPRISVAIESARRRLERRPASFILTARFIPFGRVAMNYTAGTTGFSRRLFMRCTAVSGLCWSAYAVLIGSLAGTWIGHAPLLASGVGIVLAIAVGLIADALMSRSSRVSRVTSVRQASE
jgi:membrane-associated protein